MRAEFRDGRSIHTLKHRFSLPEADPDAILDPNFIEVVHYRDKLYSMDNRRLWCLKQSFPEERLVNVFMFDGEEAYNTKYGRDAWGAKYSTICGGIDIIIQLAGHKRTRARMYGSGMEERHCKVKCSETEVMKFASSTDFVKSHHLKDIRFEESICVIMGAKRDVDMAGAIIFDKFNKNYEDQPRVQLTVYNNDFMSAFLPMQAEIERNLLASFSEIGAPEWGSEDGIAEKESQQRRLSSGNAKAIQDKCYASAVKCILVELLEDRFDDHSIVGNRWAEKTARKVHKALTCAIAGFDYINDGSWRQMPEHNKEKFMVGVAWECLNGEISAILRPHHVQEKGCAIM